MQLDRDFAHGAHLVALGGEHPRKQSLLLGHRSQRWVAPSRRFQFVGDAACPSQRLVPQTGNKGVKFDFQRQAGIRRFSLTGRQPAGAVREPSQRIAGTGPAGGGAFEAGGQQPGSRTGPFRADAEQAAARGGAQEAGSQSGHGGGGAAQAGTEFGEPGGAGGPTGGKAAAKAAQRPDGTLDRRRADHRPHLRAGGDATLRPDQQREPMLGRDRAAPRRDDDLERSLPTGADGAIDRFGAAVEPGSNWAAR